MQGFGNIASRMPVLLLEAAWPRLERSIGAVWAGGASQASQPSPPWLGRFLFGYTRMRAILTREARMITSSTRENTIAECKRRVDACYSLSEATIVPEYRQALLAMAKAWMKIAEGEQERQSNQQAAQECLQVPSKSAPEPSSCI